MSGVYCYKIQVFAYGKVLISGSYPYVYLSCVYILMKGIALSGQLIARKMHWKYRT